MGDYKKFLLYVTVFICGLSTMGVELSASRLLAPFFGASLFVWTNIIGIILISLSIGYFLGGRFADKHPNETYFYTFSLISGVLIGLIPLFSSFILPISVQAIMTSSSNDFFLSLFACILLFSFPTIFLGAIVPYAIRINSKKIDGVGKTSGRIYAVSTTGSIIGVYLPSIFLIPLIGTQLTIIFFSLLLIIISFISLFFTKKIDFLKRIFSLIIVCIVLSVIFFIKYPTIAEIAENTIFNDKEIIYETETPYSYVFVAGSGERTYLKGRLAGGIWSLKIDNKHFTNTYFDYPLVATSMNENTENVLILGLGGGSCSNSFIHAYPDIQIDGVEIDPQVIEVGKKYFDMGENNLNSIASDGRLFVKKTEKKYDIVFVDVYRDAYIPFHMATVEFFKEVRSILNDDGCICINIVTYNQGTIDAVFNTIFEVFPSVYKLIPTYSHNTFLYASNQQTDIDEIKQAVLTARDNIPFSEDVSNNEKIDLKLIFTDVHDKLEEYKKSDESIFFTDDKVPIEYMIGMDAFPFG